MARSVFTGWRTITPGPCIQCGCDDDYDCDGRGNVYCTCEVCAECGEFDAYGAHAPGCAALKRIREEEESYTTEAR